MFDLPEFYRRINPEILRGPVADPIPEMLLPRELLAQIKVKKLDMQIQQLQAQIEMLDLEKEFLVKEYKIG